MVSKAKRISYVSDESSSDNENRSLDNSNDETRKRSRKPKCFNKNALVARENRLKKKIYVNNLEKMVVKLKKDNENYIKLIDNQSMLIGNLKREIKYLKSVLANSTDIGNLVKSIRNNTGMSVSSSLDKTLSMNVSKKIPIARKTAHPWEQEDVPTSPESNDDFNLMDDIPLERLPMEDELLSDDPMLNLADHTYTTLGNDEEINQDNQSDVGVCLHVSKHRVSLEFCSSCSDNATAAWLD